MKPYPPLATLLVAAALRERGHRRRAVRRDARRRASTTSSAMLRGDRPTVVGILEDNFNYLTKMCTVNTREATLEMVAAARARGCRVAVNGSDATDVPALYLDAGADAVLLEGSRRQLSGARRRVARVARRHARRDPGLVLRRDDGAISYTAPRAQPSAISMRFRCRRGTCRRRALPPRVDRARTGASRGTWSRRAAAPSAATGARSRSSGGATCSARRTASRRSCAASSRGAARPHLVRRRHLRPDRAAGSSQFARQVAARDARTPFMIQSRADLMQPPRRSRARGRGRRGSVARRRVGIAGDSRRDGQGHDGRRGARGDPRAQGARHPRLLVPAARLSLGDSGTTSC